MAFKDVREFIAALERTGDVVRIKQEVDWELEVGAISRRAYETEGPAVLFEKVKDYPKGYRIFNGSLGTFRRVAIAMGLDPNTPLKDLYKEFERRTQQRIKPIVVKDGTCKENILRGDDVDLYRFPAPYVHGGDGGRYIATWDIIVTKDPDSDWTNWGMYRFMIHNKRSVVGVPAYYSHLGMILFGKYVPSKQPMPVAMVIGAEPLCHMAATTPIGVGDSEVEFAGALRQEPVELVKCETSDLLVPANAEIVIEGEILPDMTAFEGPFGEYPGYRNPAYDTGILCRVKAITFRNSPILTLISLGMPPDDSSVAASLTAGLSMKRRLKRHGLPVTDVYIPPYGVTHLAVVGVTRGGREVAKQIRDVLTSRRAEVNKIIVVDDDVDVFNFGHVIHAFATKCHPLRGISIDEVEAGKANPITPCYDFEERKAHKGFTALFDCTWPPEWPEEARSVKSSFDVIYPEEIKRKVIRNWESYGFGK